MGGLRLTGVRLEAAFKEILDKASEGGSLTREEALRLMDSGDDLLPLITSTAHKIRVEGKRFDVGFSRKVFLPLTNLCRNHCAYCGFRRNPNEADAHILTEEEALKIAEAGRRLGCREALITMGEKPEEKYPEARRLLRSRGYSGMVDYLEHLCRRIYAETGLYPHSNPGLLTREELARLKGVNLSMGLMLESASPRLCEGEGTPHQLSPGKRPGLRLRVLEEAGRLKIPFTTGLLIGIGETPAERVESLFAIRDLHRRHGHIQEVILQNFKPKPHTPMERVAPPPIEEVVRTLAVARLIFGGGMNLQIPPNLNKGEEGRILRSGANDWGGISPLTVDHINPEAPWPKIEELAEITTRAGFRLRERLPLYPEFVVEKRHFIPEGFRARILSEVDREGYARG